MRSRFAAFKLVMLGFFFCLFAAAALPQSAPAVTKAPAPSRDRGQLVETHFTAAALARNLLGDAIEQPVSVYLPPGYDTSHRRYPAIYLLHGFNGKIQHWTVNGYQGLDLRATMDALIAKGVVPPVIVVVANGNNAYLGSFFTNSTVTGNWADVISHDLVAFVDGRFRTLATAKSRGVAGHSMGGYGAIRLGMSHPEIFGSVYALSPCCLGFDGDMGADNPVWHAVLKLTKREELAKEPETVEAFWADVFVALSAALSPNPKHPPLYADFPFVEKDGRLVPNEPVYSEWRSKMPLYEVDETRLNLLKLEGISIDVGQYDDFSHIRVDSRSFDDALSARDVPHSFEIYAGGDHGNMIRERFETRVLPFFARTLQSEEAPVVKSQVESQVGSDPKF